MIIDKIRLQEEFPMANDTTSWPLPVCDLNLDSSAGVNGYLIKASQGLDPPAIFEIVDGYDVNGNPSYDDIPEDRILVFRIGLQPGVGQTISGLRDNLYRLLSRTLIVKLMDGGETKAQTVGVMRRCEAVHFSNKPDVQVTIECENGEFLASDSIDIPVSILDTDNPVISYFQGTAPAGLELQFTVTDEVAGFNILNHGKVRSFSTAPVSNKFELTYPLEIDDVITISTHPKSKRITLLRDAVETDLAGYINAGAVWPKLYPGVNTFEWDIRDNWMSWDIARYTPRFWGV